MQVCIPKISHSVGMCDMAKLDFTVDVMLCITFIALSPHKAKNRLRLLLQIPIRLKYRPAGL